MEIIKEYRCKNCKVLFEDCSCDEPIMITKYIVKVTSKLPFFSK